MLDRPDSRNRLMIALPLSPDAEAVVALLIVAGMFVLVLKETIPTEVVAMATISPRVMPARV